MSNLSTRAGNIRKFEIYQAKDGGGFVDASGAVTDIKYCLLYTSPSPRD